MTNTPKPKTIKQPDPRQAVFLQLYLTPSAKYFGNALQSGLKAGYSQEYSENILQEDLKWLKDGISEILGKPTDKRNLMAKAKKVLAETLDGEDKKLAQDTAKFVAKTDPEFSEKVDMTSGGESVNPYGSLTLQELRNLAGK